MELSGGAILPEVYEWLHSFIPEMGGKREDLVAPNNVPISAASEDLRQQKYSFEKLHDMFLLYSKCTDGSADTVVKALCENYFMRAFRNYKYPAIAYKTFDDLAKMRMDHNDEIIASFGESSTRLCATGLSEEVKDMGSANRQNDEVIRQMREELDIEKHANDERLRLLDARLRSELRADYDHKLEERELAISERYTALQQENQELKEAANKSFKGQKQLERISEQFDAASLENEGLKDQMQQCTRENKILQMEIQKYGKELEQMERDARAEISRLNIEMKSIARSASDTVLSLEKRLATAEERIENEERRNSELQDSLSRKEFEYKRLQSFIPVIQHDNGGCTII